MIGLKVEFVCVYKYEMVLSYAGFRVFIEKNIKLCMNLEKLTSN